MEKTTVLARLRFSVAFTEQTIAWMNRNFADDAWFVKDEGSIFLQEFGGRWREVIEKTIAQETSMYFSELGVPQEFLPYVSHGETYKGSWIMEAAIVMRGSIGQSYSILKQTAKDLPTIAEDLSGLRNKILRKVEPTLSRTISENLYSAANNSIRQRSNVKTDAPSFPPPPSSLITTNFTIDARPLAALTPAILKSHKIHLSVGVSRDSFTLENLGDEPLRDVQIGVFTSPTPKNQWTYQDSYMGNFPLVSGKQTITKLVNEFGDRHGRKLDLSNGDSAYVDCWIQDSHGIYLFNFFLEKE
ncbi:MAG: hypothetical protein NG784_11025 [Candidatus Jettenia sp.]|nr:hypothetical protein [Candidatus Jettenia sp.]